MKTGLDRLLVEIKMDTVLMETEMDTVLANTELHNVLDLTEEELAAVLVKVEPDCHTHSVLVEEEVSG